MSEMRLPGLLLITHYFALITPHSSLNSIAQLPPSPRALPAAGRLARMIYWTPAPPDADVWAMSVTAVSSPTAPAVTTSPATVANPNSTMNPSDFINLMVTQLENQDPTQPTSNQDLLAQMSQISQLQSSTTLTSSLNTMTQQNQIASAAGMIGKHVKGQDATGTAIEGNVTSVSVAGNAISLELDSNQSLTLDQVTSISPQPAGAH